MTSAALPSLNILNRVGDPNRPGLRLGRKVFRWLYGSDPQPTASQLTEIRRSMLKGDPLADAVVAMYHELPAGQGRKLVDQALEQGIHTLTDPPAALLALFEQIDHEPIWLDRDKLNLGCDVSRRIGPAGELALRNLSLMGGYLGAAAAKPLVFTGQLDRRTRGRLVETSKFWMDVTTRGGLERNSEGFKSAVRVRLMHAQVRAMLLKSDKWNMAWGQPLNQWDSMATILEFSVIFMSGLRAIGFIFSKREREAVVHLWRYVGYLMGVDERILPANEADAMRALYHVIATICDSDEDSKRLGQALASASLMFNDDSWLSQRLAKVERTLRIGYTRYVLGDKAGDALGLERTMAKYFWPAQAPLRLGSELVRMAIPPLNRALIRHGERTVQREFPKLVKQQNADTSFTPVAGLAR
jgi:hypothetical protein